MTILVATSSGGAHGSTPSVTAVSPTPPQLLAAIAALHAVTNAASVIVASMSQTSAAAGADGVVLNAPSASDAAPSFASGDSTMPTAATPELSLANGEMWGRLHSARTETSEELMKLVREFTRAAFPGTILFSAQNRHGIPGYHGSGSYHYHFCASAKSQKPGAMSRELHDLSCAFRIAISKIQQGWGVTMGSGHGPPRTHLVHSSTCTLDQMPRPHGQARVVAWSETVTKLILEPRSVQKTEHLQRALQRERVSGLSNPSDSTVLRGKKQRVDAERELDEKRLLPTVQKAVNADPDTRAKLVLRDVDTGRTFELDVRQSAEGRAVPLQDVSFDPCFVASQLREALEAIEKAASSGNLFAFDAFPPDSDDADGPLGGVQGGAAAASPAIEPEPAATRPAHTQWRTDSPTDMADMANRQLRFVAVFIALGPSVRVARAGVVANYAADYSFPKSRAMCKKFGIGAIVASVASGSKYMPMLFSLQSSNESTETWTALFTAFVNFFHPAIQGLPNTASGRKLLLSVDGEKGANAAFASVLEPLELFVLARCAKHLVGNIKTQLGAAVSRKVFGDKFEIFLELQAAPTRDVFAQKLQDIRRTSPAAYAYLAGLHNPACSLERIGHGWAQCYYADQGASSFDHRTSNAAECTFRSLNATGARYEPTVTRLLVGLISYVYLRANALGAEVVAWKAAGLVLTPRAREKHDQQVVAVSHLRSEFIDQSLDLVRIT